MLYLYAAGRPVDIYLNGDIQDTWNGPYDNNTGPQFDAYIPTYIQAKKDPTVGALRRDRYLDDHGSPEFLTYRSTDLQPVAENKPHLIGKL